MLPTIDLRGPRLDDYCFEEPHRAADATRRAYAPATSLIHDTLPHHRPAPIAPVDLGPRGPAPLPARSAILVADDFEANRRTVARNLKMQGHAVTLAENGRVALDLLRERPFDLLLLDIMMPDIDGYQVLEAIRADPALRHIPVVVLSGVDDQASVVRCIELGAADYLYKPFDPILLKARVNACLENKRLRDQEQAYLQQIQAEQDRSDRLLLNILPRPIAERLKQNQSPIAEYHDDVTVLFADIVDFTSLASRVAPAELVGLLNEVFSIFDGLAERYGLEKIKTIGDAYMAVGGLPHPSRNHADAVAEMALAMHGAMEEFSAAWGESYSIRVGISTGPVVAGVIGQKKFTYDLWGDTVNIASRMESLGQSGRIHVSETTYARLRKRYSFEERGTVYVKGKGEMATYFLTGRRGTD